MFQSSGPSVCEQCNWMSLFHLFQKFFKLLCVVTHVWCLVIRHKSLLHFLLQDPKCLSLNVSFYNLRSFLEVLLLVPRVAIVVIGDFYCYWIYVLTYYSFIIVYLGSIEQLFPSLKSAAL